MVFAGVAREKKNDSRSVEQGVGMLCVSQTGTEGLIVLFSYWSLTRIYHGQPDVTAPPFRTRTREAGFRYMSSCILN